MIGAQSHERSYGAPSAGDRVMFEHLADLKKNDDADGLVKIADGESADGSGCHQKVLVEQSAGCDIFKSGDYQGIGAADI